MLLGLIDNATDAEESVLPGTWPAPRAAAQSREPGVQQLFWLAGIHPTEAARLTVTASPRNQKTQHGLGDPVINSQACFVLCTLAIQHLFSRLASVPLFRLYVIVRNHRSISRYRRG
jgi:hypothetical protein